MLASTLNLNSFWAGRIQWCCAEVVSDLRGAFRRVPTGQGDGPATIAVTVSTGNGVRLKTHLRRHFHTAHSKFVPAANNSGLFHLAYNQRSMTKDMLSPASISNVRFELVKTPADTGQCSKRCETLSSSTLKRGEAPSTPGSTQALLAFVIRASFTHLHTK